MPKKKDPSITFLNTFGYNVWSLRGATPSGAIAFGAGTTPAGAVIADTASPILLGSGCRIRI